MIHHNNRHVVKFFITISTFAIKNKCISLLVKTEMIHNDIFNKKKKEKKNTHFLKSLLHSTMYVTKDNKRIRHEL